MTREVFLALTAYRRRTLLDLLVKSQGTLPIEALHLALLATGHRYVDVDLVRDDVAWLAQRGCLSPIADQIISISPYGERVAAGDVWLSGIARPERG
ncbi:MAG: hypothetical protein QM537_03785 [Candidatus Symbiobacter sp.]|nr:hypothetical protein [Candidatus Symbiobacter sp.]